MSYLKIPLTPAVNGQTSVIIQKKDIISVVAGGAATATIININTGVVGQDVLTLTHTAAAQSGTPVGSTQSYNGADVIQDAHQRLPKAASIATKASLVYSRVALIRQYLSDRHYAARFRHAKERF